MHSAPQKTCDYCKTVGTAYTFLSGETICQTCIPLLIHTPVQARQELFTLRSRNAELEEMLKKIADALNTPWPFPKERTEHDAILVESAISAGKALQTIGTKILKADWSQYEDIPPIVERLEQAASKLVDRAKNREQEDWAGLADVLELQDALAAKEG